MTIYDETLPVVAGYPSIMGDGHEFPQPFGMPHGESWEIHEDWVIAAFLGEADKIALD